MKVVYIASKEAFMESIQDIINAEILSFDLETTGLNPRVDDILLIQLNDGTTNYIYDTVKIPQDKINYLVEILENKLLIGFNECRNHFVSVLNMNIIVSSSMNLPTVFRSIRSMCLHR